MAFYPFTNKPEEIRSILFLVEEIGGILVMTLTTAFRKCSESLSSTAVYLNKGVLKYLEFQLIIYLSSIEFKVSKFRARLIL